MALSSEEKEKLADHFRNRDLYDPSKAPEQQVTDFSPAMCRGGEMGYAAGGDVEDIDQGQDIAQPVSDFAGPALSADTDTAHIPLQSPPPQIAPQLSSLAQIPSLPRPSLLDAPDAPGAPGAGFHVKTDESPVKSLKGDEYDQLLQYLQPSRGQRIGRAAFSGLAGLADAIMTGVAKAPSSNFQKNIGEMDDSERKDLISALQQKYQAGFKGRELDQASQRLKEDIRHNSENEKETRAARQLTQQGQDIALKHQAEQLAFDKNKLETEENKTALEQAQHTGSLWNKAKGAVPFTDGSLAVPGPNPAILARAQGKTASPAQASGPYGPTTVRNGKTYEWSPISKQYHPVR